MKRSRRTPDPSVPRLPERSERGHKGLFGRVLVVGGSPQMIGAAVLAATAALRSGSGLVQVALPGEVLAIGLSVTPELIGCALDDAERGDRALLAAAEAADVLVIGPGMATSATSRRRLLRLVRLDRPAVIDADALNLLSAEPRWPGRMKLNAVLTPHPGEMARLARHIGRAGKAVPADDAGRREWAVSAAGRLGQVVLLKGYRTVIADPAGSVVVNRTGNSSLSKAGSGDVLAGVIGSLIGQGMEPFAAAAAGAWLHGRAGENAGRVLGRRSVLARDVIAGLPEAIREAESS